AAEVLAISQVGQPFVGTTLYTIATVEIGVARNILHTWDGEVALETPSGVEQGLYVWVRDGTVVLEKDGRSVEVPKGSAALAGAERLALLDRVPDFMRFDGTPRP